MAAVVGVAAGGAAVLAVLGVTAAAGATASPKRSVVTSFYPLAWAAEQVGGSRVVVRNLTPAGAEPHDLELTPRQIDAVLDADVVFVMGGGFQPAVEAAASRRDGPTVAVLEHLPISGTHEAFRAGNPSSPDPH